MEFELTNPQDVTLTYNKTLTLLLSPGDSLFINFDNDFVTCSQSEMDKHISISGPSTDLNNTILRYRLLTLGNRFNPICEGRSEEDYKSDLLKRIDSQSVILDRFINQEGPPREFIKWANYDNIYNNGNYLVDYMFYSDYLLYKKGEIVIKNAPGHAHLHAIKILHRNSFPAKVPSRVPGTARMLRRVTQLQRGSLAL